MASMSFIVPDEVKKAFDKAYAGQNKSAVMTELMREAIAETLSKRTPPQHLAGKVQESGDVFKTLDEKDWGLTE